MAKYQKGKIVSGTVTGIESYGIFVNLEDYYRGLIHISEISNGFVKDISKYVKVGETIYARIIDVDDSSCHIKLSIKDLNYRPNRRSRQKIVETENGFGPLGENLDKWISEKFNEILKNN